VPNSVKAIKISMIKRAAILSNRERAAISKGQDVDEELCKAISRKLESFITRYADPISREFGYTGKRLPERYDFIRMEYTKEGGRRIGVAVFPGYARIDMCFDPKKPGYTLKDAFAFVNLDSPASSMRKLFQIYEKILVL